MRWTRSWMLLLPMVMLLGLASACSRGGAVKPAAIPCPPPVTVRAPCTTSPPPTPSQSWIEMVSSARGSDLEALLWKRIEVLEVYAARSFACADPAPATTATPAK